MKRSRIKRKFKRNPEVVKYKKKKPRCEITGFTPSCVHHIDHNRNNNDPSNFFSLCFHLHTGDEGVHIINEIDWIEKNYLKHHPKWKARYKKLVAGRKYIETVDKLYGKGKK